VPPFPEAQAHLHDLVRQYAEEVTKQEWPAKARAEPGDPRVGDVLDEMAIAISSVTVTAPTQQEFVGAEAERLSQLVGFRSQRLDYVDRGIPAVLPTARVVGGVVTVGFALLFGLQRGAALARSW
jgi:hypothetical protein